MITILAKFRRGRYLPLLLGLLLFGNGFLHLCHHAHLHRAGDALPGALFAASDEASARFGVSHRLAAAAGEFFCPCCSSVIDWWCSPASADQRFELLSPAEPRRDATVAVCRFVSRHRPRAPPAV